MTKEDRRSGAVSTELEALELRLLLDAVHGRYGYDFRGYSEASLLRGVRDHVAWTGHAGIAELIPTVLRDPAAFAQLLSSLTITVTEFFRDPDVYRAIRHDVVPWLASFPTIRIWHAGCATGEEVYSLAILLEEEGLLERVQVYATDLNPNAIETAKRGTYDAGRVLTGHANYVAAGGRRSLGDYYRVSQGAVILNRSLCERVVFATHSLVSDGAFGEMHLILCRNVLIYFDEELQRRALELLAGSLVRRGYLCLGASETVAAAPASFEVADSSCHIFRKQPPPSGARP